MDVLGIHHLGLAVKNVSITADFFTQCLGWQVAREVPEYPAIFVTNGHAFVTLWQTETGSAAFDRKGNIGLHHFALAVSSESALDEVYTKVSSYSGVVIEFAPELLREGPAKHFICYEPGGIRMEFIWSPS